MRGGLSTSRRQKRGQTCSQDDCHPLEQKDKGTRKEDIACLNFSYDGVHLFMSKVKKQVIIIENNSLKIHMCCKHWRQNLYTRVSQGYSFYRAGINPDSLTAA